MSTAQKTLSMPFGHAIAARLDMPISWHETARRDLVMPISYAPLRATLSMPFGHDPLVSSARLDMPISYAPLRATLSMPFGVAVGTTLSMPLEYLVRASAVLEMPFDATIRASTILSMPFAMLEKNPASAVLTMPFSMGDPAALVLEDVIGPLIRVADNRPLEIMNLNIKGDEKSALWELSAELADPADWAALAFGDLLAITVAGEEFRFAVSGLPRGDSVDSLSRPVRGHSPTSALESGAGKLATGGASARTLVNGLCAAAGLALDWRSANWIPPAAELGDDSSTPMDIIKSLAGAVRAVVQTSPDGGTLIVRPLYPVPVPRWDSAVPDAALDDVNIFEWDDDHEARDGWDSVDVMAPDPADSIRHAFDDYEADSLTFLRLWIVPWDGGVPALGTSAAATLLYDGVHTASQTDDVEIVDGAGRLSKPFYGGLSVDWNDDSLGALTVAEDGTFSAAVAGNSLATISYTTKFHRWRVQTAAARVQVFLPAGDDAGGERYTVQRGAGDKVAPALVEPLLAGIEAMTEAGRNYLDENGTDKRTGTVQAPLSSLIFPGYLVAMAPSESEPGFKAKAISLEISQSGPDAMPVQIVGFEKVAR